MVHAHPLPHAGDDEDAFEIGLQIGVVGDAALFGFEQAEIGGVEADEGDEQADVRLGERRAEQTGAGDEAGGGVDKGA